MANRNTVLFRCEAGLNVGSGHVMRCITLAEELVQNGTNCIFLTNEGGQQLIQSNDNEKIGYQIVNPTLSDIDIISHALIQTHGSYLIWDSYYITAENLEKVNSMLPTLVFDDDYRLAYYDCDTILNQNLYAKIHKYNVANPVTTYLLGGKYTLLRKQFREPLVRTSISTLPKIMLTFGGSDPYNMTKDILKWCHNLPLSCIIDVVVGKHYAYLDDLRSYISKIDDPHFVNLYYDVTRMADLFIDQDLVITAAGSTVYEIASMGIASVCVIMADNQAEVGKTACRRGFSKLLGYKDDLNREAFINSITELIENPLLRKKMGTIGKNTVDGKGAQRVAEAIHRKLN